ncbi:MAG: hydrogenase iron-sulfur subunit [Anaerolineae bacterium]|nr:hydrogenase iron-sulfur subunit [Anaerolineae bacterium]MDW8101289.1 hydrogenase iron-sulfur subunit [Anaerolineae bacterium]
MEFQPEITLFTCIYCGYMAADTAGALRIQYPPCTKLIRFPCTGKLDVRYILEAFEKGADGVIVVACPIGNCHHFHGNIQAARRVGYAKKLLGEIGLGSERLEIFYMSGGQGGTFANAVNTMVERLRKLGPNPLKNGHKG